MANRSKQKPAPAAAEPIEPVDPVLVELRAIRALLLVIAVATAREALKDTGAPDPHRLIDALRGALPLLTKDLPGPLLRTDDGAAR
jgi:hypothetical protein